MDSMNVPGQSLTSEASRSPAQQQGPQSEPGSDNDPSSPQLTWPQGPFLLWIPAEIQIIADQKRDIRQNEENPSMYKWLHVSLSVCLSVVSRQSQTC